MDLEAVEKAVRGMGQRVSGNLMEKVLNADRGKYKGSRIECGKGHEAKYQEQREKQLVTVVGKVQVKRAYYHCEECKRGVIPKDEELDIVGTSLSPGVRRMMGFVGGRGPFGEGQVLLEELAQIKVNVKAVERTAEAIGEEIEEKKQREIKGVMGGTIRFMEGAEEERGTMYVLMDGTGVPVVGRETAGRRGRGGDGKARTREAKLGCVFTQTRLDEEGRPVRDEDSTTYVGAIEEAGPFGKRIYAEASRRGLHRAKRVVVMGDGAPWIWGIAEMHFPGAIQIVDLYHALERLIGVGKSVYGSENNKWKQWSAPLVDALKQGDVESVLRSLRRLRPHGLDEKKTVRNAIEYFEVNRERMRYGKFRKAGLFVGSGVVEAGCRTVIGGRLKMSGMWWTVRGANSIISLRCCLLSGRYEDHWDARRTA
jgi:hypothetical protein